MARSPAASTSASARWSWRGSALALGFVLFLTANRPGDSAVHVRDLSPRIGAGPGGGRGGALPRRRHRPGGGARAGVGGIPPGGGRHLRPRLPARLRALLRGHAARGRGARRWRTRSASACAPASRPRASPASTTSSWISWTRSASRCSDVPWEPRYTYIPAIPSTVAQVQNAAEALLQRLQDVDIGGLLGNLTGLLADLRQETQEGGDVAETPARGGDRCSARSAPPPRRPTCPARWASCAAPRRRRAAPRPRRAS